MKYIYFNLLKYGSLFLFITCASFSLKAQESNFINYTTANGLPSQQVYDIYQDANGALWFATDRGISKYNGYFFKNFDLSDGITSTTVFKFYPQENGDIWCSTINSKMFYFNCDDEIFHPYKYNEILAKSAPGGILDDLHIDANGNYHFCFTGWGGALTLNKFGEIKQRTHVYKKDVVYEFKTIEFNADHSFYYIDSVGAHTLFKNVIHAPIKGDFFYTKKSREDSVTLLSDIDEVHLLVNGVLKTTIPTKKSPIGMGKWDDTHFWVGYVNGGLVIYDFNGNKTRTIFPSKSVTRIHRDHENGLWISTLYSGIYYSPDFRISNYFTNGSSLVAGVARDKNNHLLVSFYDGKLSRNVNGEFTSVYSSKSNRVILYQYYDRDNLELLYADNTITLGFSEKVNMSYEVKFFRKMSDDPHQTPLFASAHHIGVLVSNKLVIYDVKGQVNDVSLFNNQFYFSTQNGFFRYDTLKKIQTKIEHPLLDDRVGDLDNFRGGMLLASTGKGLVYWKNGTFQSISTRNGLASDLINDIYVQNDSTAWIGTNEGLNRLIFNKNDNYQISLMSRTHGLMDNDITDIEIIGTTVWLNTRSGLCSFPITLLDHSSKPENYFLRLTEVKVNNVLNTNVSDLSYSENRLEFNYEAISFMESGALTYRYKLQGLNNDWNYTQNLNVIFEAIPPGSYRFILQVGIDDVWSKEIIKLPFTINPPFYKTAWFIFSEVVIISLLIYLFFKFRILSYNRDISREILRQLLKRLKRKSDHFIVSQKDKKIKISSGDVLYVRSSGNYIEIHTEKEKYLIRAKISSFLSLVPDSIEYIQIHRSYIVRLDKISSKSASSIGLNGMDFKVGETYLKVLNQIQL